MNKPFGSKDTIPVADTEFRALKSYIQSRHEVITSIVCKELLHRCNGYLAAFSFGTQNGDDFDVRLCFQDTSQIDKKSIVQTMLSALHNRGVDCEIDLILMDIGEFKAGIRDLQESGNVEERLIDGFNPHTHPGAVGDTSLFSRFIFSSMRLLDATEEYETFLADSPDTALQNIPVTSEGAIGWSHFYTGCFLDIYLRHPREARASNARYNDRIAKFFSRIMLGSILAQLSAETLERISPLLTDAIRSAGRNQSIDAALSSLLAENSVTERLLDAESRQLLSMAAKVRNNERNMNDKTLSAMEARLFYEAFHQGAHRRKITLGTDPLAAYALTDLLEDISETHILPPFTQLAKQGAIAKGLYYIPFKDKQGRANPQLLIQESHAEGSVHRTFKRPPGRVIGEAALFNIPSSASVFVDGASNQTAEVYFLNVESLHSLLNDTNVRQQLRQPLLKTRAARRLDVLLRYFAYEAGLFMRGVLSYTTLPRLEDLSQATIRNPFRYYDLGMDFHDTLHRIAMRYSGFENEPPIILIHNQTRKDSILFEVESVNPYLYVVSKGKVHLRMRTKEEITRQMGEYFGESSFLGLRTSGTAILPSGASVLRIRADWFIHLTQSRQVLSETDQISPVQLLYHMAAVGYGRIYGRLLTQHHPH